MKRIITALAVLMLCVAALPACAESVRFSTPTDLCPHEHKNTKYYFDSPVYRALDEWTHSVSGRATVETYCEDCGTVLAAYVENNAEEIRDHVFRKGRCVLCGMEGEAFPVVQEIVRILEPDGNLFAADFSAEDLANAGDILVLRAGSGEPAVVLQPKRFRERMKAGETLAVRMETAGERTVRVSVLVTAEDGGEYEPDSGLLALRLYGANTAEPPAVYWTDGEDASGDPKALQASWVDGGNGGYWALSWPGNGFIDY